MDKEKNTEAVSEENIYCLNGRVPVKKAIPFGLQHVLAISGTGGTIKSVASSFLVWK